MNARDRGHRLLRAVAACVGLLIVTAGLLHGGLSAGAALTEILGFLIMMVSLVWSKDKDTSLTEEALAEQLKSQVGRRWRAEANIRGLIDRDFVPLRFIVTGSVELDRVQTSRTGWGPAFWSTRDYQSAALELYRGMPGGQLIVIGEGGSGKSVFSLMLTLAILDAEADPAQQRLPIPLPVSISSWRPTSESFARWFERRMLRAYPVIARTPKTTGKGPVWDAIFSCRRRCLPILDGLDEIPATERGEAVKQLTSYFARGAPFVLLSRSVMDLLGGFPEDAKRRIAPVPAEVAARYFEYLQGVRCVPAGQMATVLRSGTAGTLGDLLKRPLYLDLVRFVLEERQVTTAQLIATASEGGRALEDSLISWNLRRLLLSVRSGGVHKARHLAYLAEQMTKYPTNVLPWWRLADWMPASVLIASVAILAAIPAYLLALRMPVGLTRGLAIGVVSGIAFGMLRGRPIRWSDLTLVGVLLPLILAIEGLCTVGLHQGLADTIEIPPRQSWRSAAEQYSSAHPFTQQTVPATDQETQSTPHTSPVTRLNELIRGVRAVRRRDSLAVLAAIGLITTAFTAFVSALMHFHDYQRTPVTIFMAAFFGIGIASVSARLLIVSPDRMEPSTVLLRRGRRVGGMAGPLRAGLFSAVVIGVGGGMTGGLRLGLTYGVMLTIVFGLIVGVPVGLVGAVIRWLSAPVAKISEAPEGVKMAPSTLRTDRTVTVAAVIGIGTAAAAGIGMLIGPFHAVAEAIDRQSSFTIVPADGILFGLTIGLIVACFNTAWPTYALAHFWLVLMRRAPIRLARFLDELHYAEILRKEGSYILFRHYEFQRYLSEHGQEFVTETQPQPGERPGKESESEGYEHGRARN